MKPTSHLILLNSRIGTLLESLGRIIPVHCEFTIRLRYKVGKGEALAVYAR